MTSGKKPGVFDPRPYHEGNWRFSGLSHEESLPGRDRAAEIAHEGVVDLYRRLRTLVDEGEAARLMREAIASLEEELSSPQREVETPTGPVRRGREG